MIGRDPWHTLWFRRGLSFAFFCLRRVGGGKFRAIPTRKGLASMASRGARTLLGVVAAAALVFLSVDTSATVVPPYCGIPQDGCPVINCPGKCSPGIHSGWTDPSSGEEVSVRVCKCTAEFNLPEAEI